MLRIIAVIISFFLFAGGEAVPSYSFENPESVLLSAVILSDIHTETNSPSRFGKIGSTLKGVWSGDECPDVIAFAGDNTMNGQSLEWFDFYGLVYRFNKGSDVLVAMGNHDFGNTDDTQVYDKLSERAVSAYNSYCSADIDSVYYSKDYGTARFIILGSESNAKDTLSVITDSQIDWLESELADCARSGKTAVVINHNLIRGRNGRQSYFAFNLTTNNDRLDSALQNSGAKVIYVCGHSHFGIGEGSLTTDGNVTYINLPSAGNDGNYDAEGDNSEHGIGLLAEFYDGRTVLRFHNFAKGKTLETFEI